MDKKRKLFFVAIIILLFGFLVALLPTLAEMTDNSFLADVSRIVQNVLPGKEPEVNTPVEGEDFVDPREVQQVMREMKDQKRELNRLAKEYKKIPNNQDDLNKINELLAQLGDFGNRLNQGAGLRDVIQEFRDAQIWDELNKFRAKVEIPKEMKNWNKELNRLEKMLKQKKYQDLGFDLEAAKNKLNEIRATLAKVQEYYNNGDLENAMEEFDGVRQDLYPGEIVAVMQRTQELMSKTKRIKDAEVQNQVKEMFGEVISNFNEGDYRIAREIMDENFNQLSQVIYKAYSIGKQGNTKEGFLEMTDNLEQMMKNKAEEKKARSQPPQPEPKPVIPQSPVPQIPAQVPTPVSGGGGSAVPPNAAQPVPQPAE